jgi:nucleotide-binding universal stress UspA family protein
LPSTSGRSAGADVLERILVAVAEAEDVTQTMQMVTGMAKAFGSEVTVYHARERRVGPDEVEEQESIEESQAYGERMAEQLDAVGVETRVVVESVRPERLADHIVAHADEHHIDLIVIGGHHARGMRERVFGDIGRALAHRARCPVLLMPSV